MCHATLMLKNLMKNTHRFQNPLSSQTPCCDKRSEKASKQEKKVFHWEDKGKFNTSQFQH